MGGDRRLRSEVDCHESRLLARPRRTCVRRREKSNIVRDFRASSHVRSTGDDSHEDVSHFRVHDFSKVLVLLANDLDDTHIGKVDQLVYIAKVTDYL